ncbi:MAG TPA: response regulator transcription factor [Chloroflexota bacterium]|nr:response regulator transcription factor [Chloroflexota bacterium]
MSDPHRPIRVVVAGRHPVVRAGLRGLLADLDDLEVVGEGTPADDLVALARSLDADVVLLEWSDEPSPSGGIPSSDSDTATPIVLVGSASTGADLSALIRRGARGFLLPDSTADEVAEAVRSVARGLVVLDAALAPGALGAAHSGPPEDVDGDLLTRRELEVVALIAQGLPNKAIAQRLGISEHTVKFHVGSILAKLGAASRSEAVALAYRRGLIAL